MSMANGREPFSERVARGQFDGSDGVAVTFEPLNPVTAGHRLFVPVIKVVDALQSPLTTAQTVRYLVTWARSHQVGACNIITSVGVDATQSVPYLHWHLVPRRPGDGLMLPWTGQPR